MKELNIAETKEIRGGFVAATLFVMGLLGLGGIAWGASKKRS